MAVIALADLAAAALALVLFCPVLLLLNRGYATLRMCELAPGDGRQGSPALARAGCVTLVEIEGPLLFLSVPKIDRIVPEQAPWPRYLILDLQAVTRLDASALRALGDQLDYLEQRQGSYLLRCTPDSPVFEVLQRSGLCARALGKTACFTLQHALERIATLHPETTEPDHDAFDRATLDEGASPRTPRLYLVPRPAIDGQ